MKSYDKTDTAELIVACRERDDAAFSELVTRYTPMMHKVAASFSESTFSESELFAEACVALHSATMKYDTEQSGVTFGLYARVCVYNRLVDLCRRAAASARVVELYSEQVEDDSAIEAGLIRKETVQTLMSGARELLSEYEYRVLLLHVQGYKTATIAQMLSRTAKSVDNAKSRIFRRLREEYGSLYHI